MAKFQITASNANKITVSKETEKLQDFSLSTTSSGCILCCSDGTLLRVTNDSGVIDFSTIVKGSATIEVTPSEVLQKVNGSVELDGEFTWFTCMNYPQKIFIPQVQSNETPS